MTYTAFEDMTSQRKRIRTKAATSSSCQLHSERQMPKSNASPEAWQRFHEQHTTGTGGFDPCSLIR